jgi:hypothetical protein
MSVDISIVYDLDIVSMMRYFRGHDNFNNKLLLGKLTTKKSFQSDIIIASCELLEQMASGAIDLSIHCDKLILLDSLDLQRSKHDLNQYLPHPNTVLMCNPANTGILNTREVEYYHKIDPERVKNFYKNYIVPDSWSYKRIDKDHILVDENRYFENIGKSIFEKLLLGVTVNYYVDGKTGNDGLCYYLSNLFGIDPHQNQTPLSITAEEVRQEFFLKYDERLVDECTS